MLPPGKLTMLPLGYMPKNTELYGMQKKSVLVTGATGYLGSQLIEQLHKNAKSDCQIIAMDIREVTAENQLDGVVYYTEDIRSERVHHIIEQHQVDTVVHLAAIVAPSKTMTREFLEEVEVGGTRNVLDACVKHGVQRFIVTSSGAAYGYYEDNPDWITETEPIRGNYEFPYSYHKRLVEEMLEDYRKNHPALQQTIFRVGTILGKTTNNQITNMFKMKRQIRVNGADSPFVFIWDQDLVGILQQAISSTKTGIYNVAGDGALKIDEIAKLTRNKIVNLPAWLLKGMLFLLQKIGISPYGPEQVRFLQYRPVLLNTKLKHEFGYQPKKSSAEAFQYYLQHKIH